MIRAGQLAEALRGAAWLTEDRARAYGRLIGAAVLILGVAAQVKIFLPALADSHWRPLASDFDPFWSGARLALQGHPALAYNLPALRIVENTGAQSSGLFYYLYPPVWLLLCLPLAALPYPLALAAFLLAGYAACCCCLRALLPRSWPTLPVMALPVLILNATIGQNGFVTGTCFAAAMLLLDRRPALAGACLGVFAFKPQLAVGIPLLLLLGRRWAALLSCGAVALCLVLASWAVLGTAAWQGFFAATPFIGAILHDPGIWPKLVSVFTAIRLAGGGIGLALGVQAACAAVALGCVAYAGLCRPGGGGEIATLAAASLLCTPYVMDYDLVCLSVPMAWLAGRGTRTGWLAWEKTVLAACYLVPALARSANLAAGVSLAPPVMLALLAVVTARVRHDCHIAGTRHARAGVPLLAAGRAS